MHHKCGVPDKEMTPDSDEEESKKRRIQHPPTTPLLTPPLQALPEQTEPEDLSMTKGLQSNGSSGDSTATSPSLRDEFDEEDSTAIFLQRQTNGRT